MIESVSVKRLKVFPLSGKFFKTKFVGRKKKEKDRKEEGRRNRGRKERPKRRTVLAKISGELNSRSGRKKLSSVFNKKTLKWWVYIFSNISCVVLVRKMSPCRLWKGRTSTKLPSRRPSFQSSGFWVSLHHTKARTLSFLMTFMKVVLTVLEMLKSRAFQKT